MPPTPAASRENEIPLVVDLDGTLIKTDLLWESLTRLLRQNPFQLFPALFWWTRGRAFLKKQLAARVTLDPATLPFNEPFLAFLREKKKAGRKLILATASDRQMALPVADRVGLFDEVLGSDGKTNLRGANKLKMLVEKFGERGFDYAGNARPDLAVWRCAREAIVVNAGRALAQQTANCAKAGPVFPADSSPVRAFAVCLRPHQWVKNAIIFVPALAAHKLSDTSVLLREGWAFIAFCLCASSMYVLNDLADLDADRQHPGKKERPFAAGDLPLPVGLIAGPLLLLAGMWLSVRLSWLLAGVTALYLLLTTAYSWRIKQLALLDVFVLAGLYTIRLVAGHTAADIAYSAWLLMFSMFIFLSLVLVKRFVELKSAKLAAPGAATLAGRGYVTGDLELVTALGTGSGYLAALVLALYVNSQQVVILYAHPNLLLFACPLLLYWISRMWLLAHRGQMHDDPVVFALKDAVSYLIAGLALLILWLATGH
jgi:4-hydroxybenzoate polyprenyltransferase